MKPRSYRVKFPTDSNSIELAGIVDCPPDEPHPNDESSRGASDVAFRPVVVYSHCFTCNKDLKATVRIARALAVSGVTVLRYDMRGLGGSGGKFESSNFSTNLVDLSAAIDFANRELGPVTGLVGHSFGGIASLVAAVKRKDSFTGTLDRLGFVATLAAPSDTQHLAALLLKMNPSIERDGRGEVSIGGIQWTITQQMVDDFRHHRFADSLSQVACPVLILHSPKDETVSFDHAVRLMQLIQRPDEPHGGSTASLVTLPGADHLLANNPADLRFVSELIASWCFRFRGPLGD